VSYDPEKGSARDLPRERYLRVAYMQMRQSFGPELLGMIAARGEDEFKRVCGAIFSENGFIFTPEELGTMYRHLEAKAVRDMRAEKVREAWLDDGHQRTDKPERPH
jgi:hypothetical protein